MSGEESNNNNVAANDRGNDVADPRSSEKLREELLREELAKYASEAVETAISERAATILQKRTADQNILVTGSDTPNAGTSGAGEYNIKASSVL